MQFRDLEEWKTYCERSALTSVDRDRALLATGWVAGAITPPPTVEDPAARSPLERARELEDLAAAADPESGRRHLESAVAWLDHPHPRASRGLVEAMRRRRADLHARLRGRADP